MEPDKTVRWAGLATLCELQNPSCRCWGAGGVQSAGEGAEAPAPVGYTVSEQTPALQGSCLSIARELAARVGSSSFSALTFPSLLSGCRAERCGSVFLWRSQGLELWAGLVVCRACWCVVVPLLRSTAQRLS